MKVGIIGAGMIGKCLAQKLSNKGHQVLIANSRGPQTIDFADGDRIKAVETADAVKDVDAVVLSIPFGKVPALPKELFRHLDPAVPVIETMNYFPQRDEPIEAIDNGQPHSAWVQEQLGRPVVKAFNNIGVASFVREGLPKGTPGRIALAVSGDNNAWKKIAIQLVDDTGFDAVDAGSIADSWRQEPGTPAYCTDLPVEELKQAFTRADRQQAIANRNAAIEKLGEYGEEYMKQLVAGVYADDFEDVTVNIQRSLNGIPLK